MDWSSETESQNKSFPFRGDSPIFCTSDENLINTPTPFEVRCGFIVTLANEFWVKLNLSLPSKFISPLPLSYFMGQWVTRKSRFHHWLMLDTLYEWEINFCPLRPLRFGTFLLLLHYEPILLLQCECLPQVKEKKIQRNVRPCPWPHTCKMDSFWTSRDWGRGSFQETRASGRIKKGNKNTSDYCKCSNMCRNRVTERCSWWTWGSECCVNNEFIVTLLNVCRKSVLWFKCL